MIEQEDIMKYSDDKILSELSTNRILLQDKRAELSGVDTVTEMVDLSKVIAKIKILIMTLEREAQKRGLEEKVC